MKRIMSLNAKRQYSMKRVIDFAMAVILSILFLPIMLLTALAIKLSTTCPVIFKSKRIGLNNSVFTVYKFCTMRVETKESGRILSDRQRLTPVGSILRRTSIDELPQLLNIIKGEMSFIGPRPMPVQYGPWFTEEESHRHDILPGITGWAQINGRSNVNWEEKFRMDLYYVTNISPYLDIKILFSTIKHVLKACNIQLRGEYYVSDFDEYRKKQLINNQLKEKQV